jgi:hypothetical protein
MSSSKKGDLQRDFAAVVYQSEAQNPIPPTLYTYSHREGAGGGRVEPEEKVREATVHKAGSEIPTLLTVSPVYKL